MRRVERLGAVLRTKSSGSTPLGEARDLGVEAALAARDARGARGLAARGVAVEEHDDVGREALEQLGLRRRERGAERRDDVVDAARVERDDVEVALDEDGLALLPDRLARLVAGRRGARPWCRSATPGC